jgi:hypothetical protein
MRNFATAILTAAVLAWGAPADAQSYGFGAHAGASLPTGDYSGAADMGFSGGLDLLVPLGFMPPSLSWYSSVDAVGHSAAHEGVSGGFLHVPLLTGVRLDVGPFGPIRPFATGQLGLSFTNGPDTGVDDTGTNTVFAFGLGGGLQLTENAYAGVKWFNLGDIDFGGATVGNRAPSFVDLYLGFGVR